MAKKHKNNKKVPKRISKRQHYMNIAREVAARTSCFRARHGVVIVKDDQVISTGYVGRREKLKIVLKGTTACAAKWVFLQGKDMNYAVVFMLNRTRLLTQLAQE